jgi:hypothetical protein
METPVRPPPSSLSGLDLLPSPPRNPYSELSNEELIFELKKSKDFEKFVFPNSWYAAYDLPMKTAMDTKEFLREAPWKKTSQNWYITKTEIPAKPGGLRPILPAPEVPIVTVIQNSFSDATDQTVSSDQPETQ